MDWGWLDNSQVQKQSVRLYQKRSLFPHPWEMRILFKCLHGVERRGNLFFMAHFLGLHLYLYIFFIQPLSSLLYSVVTPYLYSYWCLQGYEQFPVWIIPQFICCFINAKATLQEIRLALDKMISCCTTFRVWSHTLRTEFLERSFCNGTATVYMHFPHWWKQIPSFYHFKRNVKRER